MGVQHLWETLLAGLFNKCLKESIQFNIFVHYKGITITVNKIDCSSVKRLIYNVYIHLHIYMYLYKKYKGKF